MWHKRHTGISLISTFRSVRSALMGVALGLALTISSQALALSEVPWLYQVDQDVQAQSMEARDEAARAGLLTVLSRVTGLASVPRTEAVVAALENIDRYYGSFVFLQRRTPGGDRQQYLRLTYDADAVLGLVRAAQLPVWWSQRPTVLVWLVLDDGQARRVLTSEDAHPLLDALQQRALERGLPVKLPQGDDIGLVDLSAEEIWTKQQAGLDLATLDSAPDLILVGRFTQTMAPSIEMPGPELDDGSRYRGEWEVWLDEEPMAGRFSNRDVVGAVAAGVDDLTNRLAERFAVLPRNARLHPFTIAQVDDVAAYADLMRYLRTLEFIDQIDVEAVEGGRLRLHLGSRAGREQLLMLLTTQQRLELDESHFGVDTQLLWRG